MSERSDYEAGATLRDICAAYGLSSPSVAKRRIEHQGGKLRPTGAQPIGPTDARVAQAQQLRARGLTLDQIADAMGLASRSTALRYLKRATAP